MQDTPVLFWGSPLCILCQQIMSSPLRFIFSVASLTLLMDMLQEFLIKVWTENCSLQVDCYSDVCFYYRYEVWSYAGHVDRSLCNHVFVGYSRNILSKLSVSISIGHDCGCFLSLDSSSHLQCSWQDITQKCWRGGECLVAFLLHFQTIPLFHVCWK